MPEGPLGAPRLNNIGPLSRATEKEIKDQWEECPDDGKPLEICLATKEAAINILADQGVFPQCIDLIDINSGNCFDIADKVTDKLSYVNVLKIGDNDHVWIEYNGIHYDAEAPSGVESFRDLPIFDRIDPRQMLDWARMAAEMEGREKPETVEETVVDVTDEYR